jgi:carboxypeptidase family protein
MINNFVLRKATLLTVLMLPAVVFFLSVPTLMEAQAISGDLLGVVTDPSGAVISGATVVATNLGTGVKSTTKTNASGEFRFVNLPVGHYSLQMTSAGMTGGYKDVQVELNHQVTANIMGAVASASTTVEVTGEAPSMDTSTPQIQNTFAARQIQDLPTATIGLGVLNLSLLNAGVATSGGIGAGTGPSISGQRPRNNNFTIEGVDNNSKAVTGPLLTVPNDAIENFTVLQNQFAPEYGHSSGGQFNQTIVSGTNQWHGRLYEYFQNRNLNAIDAQNARTQTGPNFINPAFDANRFGGQVGGPIVKDKVFFFTNQEYNPTHQALGSLFICTPTATGYAQIAATPGVNQNNLSVLKQFQGTAPAAGGSNCTALGATATGGSIGAELGEIDFSPSVFNNTFTSVNSVDVNLTDKDQLRFRYIYQRNNSSDAVSNIPAFFTTVPVRDHVITFSEFHAFAAKLTNEFRLGFNRNTQFFTAGNFAFPGLADFPNLTFDDTLNQVGPDPNAPQFGIQNVYQATDNLTWIKGKHTLQFGVEGRKYISPQGFTQRARGDYEYGSTEEFLFDQVPSSFGQRSTGNNTYYGDQSAIYVYGNDQFRITKNLTLNAGLRYEFTSVPFSERLQSLNAAASVAGLINFVEPQPQYKNFAPRLGFAYSPGNSGNTVIRGGFGMAYDILYDNLGLLAVPPQFGGTCDVNSSVNGGPCSWSTAGFLAGGGLPAGSGSGLKSFPTVAAQRAATANLLPAVQKLPYTETWNLGVERAFGKNYTAEVRYVGTRGVHLPVQDQIDIQSVVSPTNFLPTFLTTPDAATLATLTKTLADVRAATPRIIPAYTAAGFQGAITSFQPFGQSIYHGLQTQLTRRFSNGLQMLAAYTWSHARDNSTADVFSTLLTPRRPQDSQNFKADMSTSALDRRQRLTLAAIYEVPMFKNSSNWMAKNLLGNWEIAPTWQLQSPEFYTPQSSGPTADNPAGTDSNLNGDSAPDRTIFNASGAPGTGSPVTAICTGPRNANGSCPAANTVGYIAVNPNAQYIQAGPGALANAARNTLATPRTNNWDLTVKKSLTTTEKTKVEFAASAFNLFNHSQFIPGSVNTVNSIGYTGITSFVRVGNSAFDDPKQAFANNARVLQLVAKFVF